MKEKILLSFIAGIMGLLVAGGIFYIYEMTKNIQTEEKPRAVISKSPTSIPLSPTPANTNYLTLDNPKDEAVLDKKVISISGKVTPGSILIASSQSSDQVITPSKSGNFSLTHTLEDKATLLNLTAYFPDGNTSTITRTLSYFTEDF